MTDRLLTILAFAQYICGSTRTARRILASGELPSYRVGGRVMVKFSDVEVWLEGKRIEPQEPNNSLKSIVAKAVERARQRRAS
jgi:excisionase family DNA binding protein